MGKFVLNDETKVNSYGFKILNNGINLDRFIANPVMLNQHENNTTSVVGRWNNLRIEGNLLVADSEFDMDDNEASLLAGKVERGFIKGVSMGISFDPIDFDMNKALLKCELFEASICAIPSNANALSLYTKAGKKLDSKQVTKLLSFNQKLKNMDLLKQLIALLQLDENSTEEDVLNAVKDLLDKSNAVEDLKIKEIIDNAILEGRIHAPNRDFYTKSLKADFNATLSVINSTPKKQTLFDKVNNTPNKENRVNWTLTDYRKKDPEALRRDPVLYNRLLAKESK